VLAELPEGGGAALYTPDGSELHRLEAGAQSVDGVLAVIGSGEDGVRVYPPRP